MTPTHLVAWGIAALLVFWAVGAYNRLVRLRNEIARAYGPVDAQFQLRQGLLRRWQDVLRTQPDAAGLSLDALDAASSQLQIAADRVRKRPSAVLPMTSLRMAEQTLADARARLGAELAARVDPPADPALSALAEELARADAALAFAGGQFNRATADYNAAVRQFPTWLLAALFGFRGAGNL